MPSHQKRHTTAHPPDARVLGCPGLVTQRNERTPLRERGRGVEIRHLEVTARVHERQALRGLVLRAQGHQKACALFVRLCVHVPWACVCVCVCAVCCLYLQIILTACMVCRTKEVASASQRVTRPEEDHCKSSDARALANVECKQAFALAGVQCKQAGRGPLACCSCQQKARHQ